MAHNAKGSGVIHATNEEEAKTVKILVEFTVSIYPYPDDAAIIIANRLVRGELPDLDEVSWFSNVEIISSNVVETNSE